MDQLTIEVRQPGELEPDALAIPFPEEDRLNAEIFARHLGTTGHAGAGTGSLATATTSSS